MSRNTSVSLTEQEEQTLQWIAQQTGTTEAALLQRAVRMLIAEFQNPYPQRVKRKRRHLSDVSKVQARERFERHFGILHFDIPMSVNNEDIDADLAMAYAANHEKN